MKWIDLMCVALTLTGCSLERSDEARLRLEITGQDTASRYLGSALAGRDWRYFTDPGSVDEMDCLVLNVMGPGIPILSVGDADSYVFNRDFPQVLAGDSCKSYAGAMSTFVAVPMNANQGAVIELTVPTGPQRLIQLLGMKTGALGCPQETYLEVQRRVGKAQMEAWIPQIYEVGRAQANVVGDLTITLNNTYNAANPKTVDCDDGGSNASSPPALTELALWLSADSAAGVGDGVEVLTWADKGTSSASITAVPAYAPIYIASAINGKPALRFNGTSQKMLATAATGLADLNGQTFLVVYQPNATGGSMQPIMTTAYTAAYFRLIQNLVGGLIELTVGIGSSNESIGNNLPVAPARLLSISRTANTTTATTRIDGQASGNVMTTGHVTGALTSLVLGFEGGDYFKGDLAEILYYNRTLSSAELLDAECYLSNKYLLAIPGCG